MKWLKKAGALVAIVVLIFVVWALQGQVVSKGNIYTALKLLDQVIVKVSTSYVDSLDIDKLIQAGIKGALSALDPYTQFFTPKEYEDMKIDTQGKFEGVGLTIGIRDGVLTVISPIEGSPSYRLGIRAGDQILKINGKSTKGITIDDAVRKLRGPKGTQVTISIKREGEPELIDYTITRDVIEIKAVPYYGMIDSEVGYVRLARYSETAGSELEKALLELKKAGAKGIIFDLRGNPGGLLREAVDVASLFLPKGSLVVFTQGQNEEDRVDYTTYTDGVWKEGELVVLVDGGTASAAEITAGAIQDNDRGIIFGERTFGKGLVQSILPLQDGNALKVTTAKYYMPSGRCVQKEDYLRRKNSAIISQYSEQNDTLESGDKEEFEEENMETPEDTTNKAENQGKPYKTLLNKRTVYGGGGVSPDYKFVSPKVGRLETELERKTMFFGFAVHYTTVHPNITPDFKVTDEVINEFREYLKEKKFTYKSKADEEIENLRKIAEEMGYTNETKEKIEQLSKMLEKEKEREFEHAREYIEMAIKREIFGKLWGDKARYEASFLPYDPAIKEATKLIKDRKKYYSLLKP